MKNILLFMFLPLTIWSQKTVTFFKQSPNIIIILADDLGYRDVGFNGCKDIPTPGIDRIAKQGVVFSAGYVSYAVCGPSRAGLLTGRYQDRFGFGRNPVFAPNDSLMGLPLSEQTMADYLKQAGYSTAVFGKWHLGAHKSLHPNKRGFDEFYGFLSGGHKYFPEELVNSKDIAIKSQFEGYNTRLLRNQTHVDETEYLTDAFSREAIQFVKKNQTKPFLMYLAYNAPHTPLQATQKYLDRFANIKDEKRRTYAAMVSAVDDGIGNLLRTLDELKLTQNTIVFFLSDNGGPLKDNGSSNGELRGKKGDLFEGGIRVPFAVQWPGQIPKSMIYDKPVISLDIFGTIAGLIKKDTKNPLDGVNLIPFLKGTNKGNPHDYLFWRMFDKGDFAVRTLNSKLIFTKQKTELFDIQNDMLEKSDKSVVKPAQVLSLNKKMIDWKELIIDPKFLGLMQDDEYSKLHPDRWKIDGEF